MTCIFCKITKESGTRLPHGWKRHSELVYCEKCWGARYLLRAVIMPVVEPMDATWEELNTVLKAMFRSTTAASNWIVTELAKRDVQREPGQEKMPAMPRAYLYPEARAQFPDLPPQTVVSLEQAIQRKYRSKRYEVLWRCTGALPTYRYPQPFPVHNQSWSCAILGDRPQVSVRIADRRYVLRLKGGPRFRRQLNAYRAIVSGEAAPGELALYRAVDGKELLCKMVVWLPRGEAPKAEGTLCVRTAPDALLIAASAKDEALWRYKADQVKQWTAEHRRLLQCWAEDSKFEYHVVARFQGRREAAARKYHNRMHSLANEVAHSLAAYARRRHFAAVEYNDSETSFCPDFPWRSLSERVKSKLHEFGVEFIARGAGGDSG
jgi:hypothetical protein